MEEHIQKVEDYIGRKITRLKAEKDFMYWATEHERVVRSTKIPGVKPGDIVRGYGYPSVFSRWCTKELKTNIISRYLRNLKKDYEIVQYIGIAYDEPKRLKEDPNIIYPLVLWKMIESDCLEYCYARGFDWGGLYKIWDRVSCWCCPLQSPNDLRKLRDYRPELWLKLKEMDAIINAGDTRLNLKLNFQQTRSLTDIERRFEVEDEFIAQGKKLRTKEFFEELKRRNIKY